MSSARIVRPSNKPDVKVTGRPMLARLKSKERIYGAVSHRKRGEMSDYSVDYKQRTAGWYVLDIMSNSDKLGN